MMPTLLQQLSSALRDVMTVVEESDGALTVTVDGTVASLRVVMIAEGHQIGRASCRERVCHNV